MNSITFDELMIFSSLDEIVSKMHSWGIWSGQLVLGFELRNMLQVSQVLATHEERGN